MDTTNTISQFRTLPDYPLYMTRIIGIYLLVFAGIGLWGYLLISNSDSFGALIEWVLDFDYTESESWLESQIASYVETTYNLRNELVVSVDGKTVTYDRTKTIWTAIIEFTLQLEDSVTDFGNGIVVRASGIERLSHLSDEQIALLIRIQGGRTLLLSVVSFCTAIGILMHHRYAWLSALLLNAVIFLMSVTVISNSLVALVVLFSGITFIVIVFDDKVKAIFWTSQTDNT